MADPIKASIDPALVDLNDWEQEKPELLAPADASLVRVAATLVEAYRP